MATFPRGIVPPGSSTLHLPPEHAPQVVALLRIEGYAVIPVEDGSYIVTGQASITTGTGANPDAPRSRPLYPHDARSRPQPRSTSPAESPYEAQPGGGEIEPR